MNKQPKWLPWAVLGVAVLYLVGTAMPRGERDDQFHYAEFGTLPVQDGGRVKPWDTFARVRMLQISHGQRFSHGKFVKDPDVQERDIIIENEITVRPAQWGVDTLFARLREDSPAFDYRVFRIDSDQVVNFLKLPKRPGSWLYSWNEFAENEDFNQQFNRIIENDGPKKGDLFEAKIAELGQQVMAFEQLAKINVRLVHPSGGGKQIAGTDWLTLPAAAQQEEQGAEHKALDYFREMLRAYSKNQPSEFNAALTGYQKYLERTRPDEYHSARLEAFFNRFDPFVHCITLYGLVLVLGAGSWLSGPWLGWSRPLQKSALWLALLVLAVHTWALVTRVILTGRPPVTNLYSSAVFIGWGCVGLGIVLEWIFKNGIGIVVAALTGMLTLVIARNLVSGDTMEVLEAVLDTNFWLATHVICITLGYTTMFVAGFLGIAYVMLGMLTPLLRGQNGSDLTKMIYGVTCFSTLFSFVGTVLGGIWADESWGRFWGWDPKENGALLIVIWSALVLHARWGGVVKARGLACLSIFGICVTAWSWFGTNFLGVGLHSYGFMQAGMFWLKVVVGVHLILILIGALVPLHCWKSFAPSSPPPQDTGAGRASVALTT